MIHSLSTRYRKLIASVISLLFYLQLIAPLQAAVKGLSIIHVISNDRRNIRPSGIKKDLSFPVNEGPGKIAKPAAKTTDVSEPEQGNIGGPGGPEASSFKAVGSNDLVNLFTGDFSYNIPLLDVGGYPVNLFYNGGISMEQEASWVGLGWNINPGSVSRNMRGIPDDFNGEDSLIQYQNLKPNRTWGAEIGVDGELIGIKKPKVNLSLGFSHNNYLGPAIEVGASASISLVTIENIKYEKSATANIGLDLGLGAKLSSRSGLTFSPSLNANVKLNEKKVKTGIGLNTSYNSRTGISSLNLHAEMSQYKDQYKTVTDEKTKETTKTYTGTSKISGSLGSSSFSFAKPSYTPSLRMPMENSNTSGQIELGAGIFGLRGAVTGNGYYSESKVPVESRIMKKPMVGFIYNEKAVSNKNAVMDFNRVNDAEVTPNTPVISAPQYAYDVFSIQGEGTGGSIRAYRGDLGYMRDNLTVSKDNNISLGFDVAPPGHYGMNWTGGSSPTSAGGWEDANNKLKNKLNFKPNPGDGSFEQVYFKNPGEATVTNESLLSRLGNDNLVRFTMSGSNVTPRLEPSLEQFDKKTGSPKTSLSLSGNINLQKRDKRTQVTTMLNAEEASRVGLEKEIRNYSGSFDGSNHIQYTSIPRVGDQRKAHHISQIDVLEQTGMRYVYGLPVYNLVQKDFTFSVKNLPADLQKNLVDFSINETGINSPHMNNSSKIDGYVETQVTPGYASAFLITGLLSPDYVDMTENGITEDDQGTAVKFNYTKSADNNKWRTPRNNTTAQKAFFNDGLKTEKKDNKATISYGEREAWYLNSIESKSMIAIFKTSDRDDAKGVLSDLDGRVNTTEQANKKLDRIDLYTKAEIKAKGISLARPIKSVIFNYDSSLCIGTPDHKSGGGKLTLKSIYFSYNGQTRLAKDRYVFNYGNLSSNSDNPSYSYNASDRWGTFKDPSDAAVHPHGLNNMEYPYTDTSKTKNDQFAAAWCLKKILLPSGGEMEIQYEAKDYAYVQDRRASNMFNIYGLGLTTAHVANNTLYNSSATSPDNFYVYVKLPKPLVATSPAQIRKEIFELYLKGVNQLAFKLWINMPKGYETITAYSLFNEYGVCPNTNEYIYIKLTAVDGKSPLAKSAIGFLTGNIPGQAFPGYEAEVSNLEDFIDLAGSMLTSLKNAFKNVDDQMRAADNARFISLDSSFVRLNNPYWKKYGGGVRVKKVLVKDNWKAMTKRTPSNTAGEYNSVYGQEYDYTTAEIVNGKPLTISSGVASYEPGIGSEENPFREIIQFNNKLPLSSAEYGALEMPVMEAFYPSPLVGYSKITVRSIHRKGTHGDSTLRSAIGKQVTEFFTAKDYPCFSTYTPMHSMEYNKNPFFSFFYKEVISRRTVSQGFLVETNDMHGRIKSQMAFSENDERTPLSASYHTYKNTGKNGFNDKFDFVHNDEGGIVKQGNMGIDVELMTDVREFKVESNSFNGQAQSDMFPAGFPFFVITSLPLKTYQENKYRAVTCTKLISYHAVEDSVIVMDKGSVVTTKTLAYDAESGAPVVTRTANEFNDPIYNTSYPAYWAYSGTGPAYKNIGTEYHNVDFSDGRIDGAGIDTSIFESGDELLILDQGESAGCPASGTVNRIWAFDLNKNNTALTVPVKDLVFMDSAGLVYSRAGVSFRIIRSGKRNNLGLTIGSASSMANPIQTVSSNRKLVIDNSTKVVSASAMEFKEKWQADQEVFYKRQYYIPPCSDVEMDSLSCNGIWQKSMNPYVKGLVGNYKPYRTYTYYGERTEAATSTATNIRKNGYISNFGHYWSFDASHNMIPNTSNPKWVWNSELMKVNSKGQELETRDALNRYTAAQYGFAKNMPVAVVQNARYGESFSEGFEDRSYSENLNAYSSTGICPSPYFDFGSMVITDTVRAHSGTRSLKVNANSSVSRSIPVSVSNPDTYHFDYARENVNSFIEGNFGSSVKNVVTPALQYSSYTYPLFNYGTPFVAGQPNVSMRAYKADNSGGTYGPKLAYNGLSSIYYSFYETTQSFYLPAAGSFNISLNALQSFLTNTSPQPTPIKNKSTIRVKISKQDGTQVFLQTLESDDDGGTSASDSYTVSLACGMYKVECQVQADLELEGDWVDLYKFSTEVSYNLGVVGILGKYVSCTYNKPIPAEDSMINPAKFSLTPGRRMQFSAWVKEDCSTPCFKTDFTNCSIEVRTGGSSVSPDIKRRGAVIEGWQKIEGEFTLPADSGSAQLVFINGNNQPMYVDDIRMHPYNANMKSFVYDPRTLRLTGELDENNYAGFYEYDEEGQLIRVKKETIQGIKTIKESRNAKQKTITDFQ